MAAIAGPAVAGIALANLRYRAGRWLLLAIGVALAMSIPVIATGAGKVVAAETLRRTVAQLEPGLRTTIATYQQSIFNRGAAASVDRTMTANLSRLSSAPIRRQLLFRELASRGAQFFLGAADGLPAAVRIVSGRAPAGCTPRRCEVVLLGGHEDEATAAKLTLGAADLGVIVVGRAERVDAGLLAGTFDPGGVPLLVGNGVSAMSLLDSLTLFPRTYGWVTALDVERILALGVPEYVRLSGAVSDDLDQALPGTAVYAPDGFLQAEDARAAVSARRFGALGGSAAVLLLGFAVLGAVGLRRENTLLVAVLRRRGAGRGQVVELAAAQCVLTCAAGAVLGAGLGVAAAAVLADRAGLPVAHTAWSALRAASPAALALALAAAALAALVLLWPDRPLWQAADIVAVGCLGTAVLATDRGASDLSARSDPLVVALPVLAAVTGGLAAARLWPVLTALVARLLPRRSVAGRIGLVGAVRRPLRLIATTAFLTASVASVVFAGAYRATLLAAAADQAAFAVPVDATITRSRDVANPLTVTSSEQLARSGSTASAVARLSATVRGSDNNARSVAVLGLDPDVLARVHRWGRTTGSTRSAASVAAALRQQSPAGPPITPGRVELPFRGKTDLIAVSLWVASADGREVAVELTPHGSLLRGDVPDLGAGTHVVALVVGENAEQLILRGHAIGEGEHALPYVTGRLQVAAGWDWAGWSSASATVAPAARSVSIDYRLDNSLAVLVPSPRALPPFPVAVDPATAASARDDVLGLKLGDLTVPARIVAVLPRFPTAGATFVIADRRAVAAVIDRTDPGAASSSELWVSGRLPAGTPLDRVTVVERQDRQRALESDPVGRGSRLLLLLVAGLALLVAAAALVLLVSGERADGAGELYAWEADGMRPATLRRIIVVRALSVVAVGLPLGLVTGLVLARAGTTLLAVDASGTVPTPPLQLSVGLGWSALVLLGTLGGALLLVGAVASRLLRERLPLRPGVDLR